MAEKSLEKIVALTWRLITCRAVSGDVAAVNRAVDELRNFLQPFPLHFTEKTCGDRRVLYVSTHPGFEVDYLLNAHLDVVPADDADFLPRLEDGKLYGRGAKDCQGNAAVIAQLLTELAGKATVRVGAIFTTDEEIGGATTALMLTSPFSVRRMVLIVDGDSGEIAYAQKGVLSLKLVESGRGGHASEPWECDNPVERLMRDFSRLQAVWPALPADCWGRSLTATVLKAGQVANQIPDTAELQVNIRYVAPEEREVILSEVRNSGNWQVELLHDCPPVYGKPDAPALLELRRAMTQTTGRPVKLKKMHGATDAYHFARAKLDNIAIIGTTGGNLHSPGEWAELDGYRENLDILRQLVAPKA